MIELKEYIELVKAVHNEFEDEDIQSICEDYINSFPKKTKEDSIKKSLKKYLIKEFQLQEDNDNENYSNKTYTLDSIPKIYFENGINKFDEDLIQVSGVDKHLGHTKVFEDLNLTIKNKDKIALIGVNGSGKTTLLKLITKIIEPDVGEITHIRGLNIGYMSQDLFGENINNTVKEEMLSVFPEITSLVNDLNILKSEYSNNHTDEIANKINIINEKLKLLDGFKKYNLQLDILKYFGFDEKYFDKRLSLLSGGEQTKLQIAKFLIAESHVLILDEPTNHLDIEGIAFLEKFCKLRQKALIVISHDKKFIKDNFDKICEISKNKAKIYYCNYEKYLIQKQNEYENQRLAFNSQQKYLDKQTEFITRFRSQASKASNVQSRIKMLDKIEIIEQPEDELTVRNIRLGIDIRLPNLIMKIQNLVIGYSTPLFTQSGTLEINKDAKIGVIGKNGIGKTTLLKTILGEIPALGGTYEINEKIRIGSFSQSVVDLNMDNSIIEEVCNVGVSQTDARTILGNLLIIGDKVFQKIQTLSGGEKAKVAL
ncbi:MAG: ABC-F family ATP-binding cassette domain-containing protein, partial [Candidatus Absconditabacteria bacterium]